MVSGRVSNKSKVSYRCFSNLDLFSKGHYSTQTYHAHAHAHAHGRCTAQMFTQKSTAERKSETVDYCPSNSGWLVHEYVIPFSHPAILGRQLDKRRRSTWIPSLVPAAKTLDYLSSACLIASILPPSFVHITRSHFSEQLQSHPRPRLIIIQRQDVGR